jgi:predicted Ser/Thr protein kinase
MKMGFDSRSGGSVVFTESAAPRAPAPASGDLAAHFPELEIRELVAQGGMGCVYRARQKSLERDVALKILTVGAEDPSFAGRFEREARTLAGLSHPGIVSVFEFGQRGKWAFLVMEFVEGASLRQMMRAKTVGARESLSIVTQMCDALQYAHDQGVVHRDIKPENVLVTRDGRVKVLDFGLAKLVRGPAMTNLTQTRQVMGTPHYMAPEQWEKPASVDHRADIYAMGVVFYELLTGELPLGRFQAPSKMVAVDVRLDDVVLKSLEKEPGRRYQHASEVRDGVDRIATTPAGARVERGSRVLTWSVGALGCFVLLMVAAVGSFLVYGGRSVAPLETASGKALGDSTTEHVEKNSPLAHVAAGFVDLRLSTELGERLGLQPAAIDALNADLEIIWKRYLQLEQELVTCTWMPDGWLELRVAAAPERYQALVQETNVVLAKALGEDKDLRRYEAELHKKADTTLRFGAKAEHLAVLVDKGMSHSRGLDPDDESTWNAWPAESVYVRLWQRMLPTRPSGPK